ncbi:MAG: translation initiation factor IF-2 subunit gamma [Halobacteria archaeon]
MKPECNIGTAGHVDHGKTSLLQALTGVWTSRYSDELRQGITKRIGYADATFRKCETCKDPDGYTTAEKCPACGGPAKVLRTVSFVDAPGHESLMATMLSGAALMDGTMLVVAANEKCPQPQTKEHLMALDLVGNKNIVIVQNKVDRVSKEGAKKNREEIRQFVKGTVAEGAPVIPVSAAYRVNLDAALQALEERVPTPARDPGKPPRFLVARSFDVNKPGAKPESLRGGVLGGSLLQGRLKMGDEIELRPGLPKEGKGEYQPLVTEVASIACGGDYPEELTPGGLAGIGTLLDPAFARRDQLIGQVVGKPGALPPVRTAMALDLKLLERAVGVEGEARVEPLKPKEPLVLSVGTMTTVGFVTAAKGGKVEMTLKRPVCAEEKARVAVSRKFGDRWHLIGVGSVQ